MPDVVGADVGSVVDGGEGAGGEAVDARDGIGTAAGVGSRVYSTACMHEGRV